MTRRRPALLVATALAAAVLGTGPGATAGTTPAAAPPATTSTSTSPTTAMSPTSSVTASAASAPVGDLAPQQQVVDAGTTLVMQGDGNLVLYRAGGAAWDSRTAGNPGARFVRQLDGNLVVYGRDGRPLWSSGTDGLGAVDLQLVDGRLTLAHPSGRTVWQDGTFLGATMRYGSTLVRGDDRLRSPGRGYDLLLQGDGNLVVYRAGGVPVWSSGTDGSDAGGLALQADGNLVLYARGAAVWFTGTQGAPDTRLVMQDDGNLVLYGGSRALWDSKDVTGVVAQRPLPPFSATVAPVTAAQLGTSYRAGCPVAPVSLRQVRLSYVGFDGRAATGEVVVHADVAAATVGAFRRLYDQRFPVERMVPVTVYGSSDDASMAAGNTSAFNCRATTGGTSWSEHSYGRALDVNPVQNPYVSGSTVLPPAGRAFTDRSVARTGMVTPAVVAAFAAEGFAWGGAWTSPKDYQHFSTTGR